MTEYRVRKDGDALYVESRRWDALRSPNATTWKPVRRGTRDVINAVGRWMKQHRPAATKFRISGDGRVTILEEA